MVLAQREHDFLKEHGIGEDEIFDAREMSERQRREFAKANHKSFMVGKRCSRGGHRLRTVAGHCMQCDTSKIAYQTRHRKTGHVYVAYSEMKQLAKVGCTEDLFEREKSLRDSEYGGAYDWGIIEHRWTKEMGALETKVRALLAQYSEQGFYFKDGRQQGANELFRCCPAVAIDALNKTGQGDVENIWYRPKRIAPVINVTEDMHRELSGFDWFIRTRNCLRVEKIVRIGDLVQYSEEDLLRIPNFGRRSLKEVQIIVENLGLQLGVNIRDWN